MTDLIERLRAEGAGGAVDRLTNEAADHIEGLAAILAKVREYVDGCEDVPGLGVEMILDKLPADALAARDVRVRIQAWRDAAASFREGARIQASLSRPGAEASRAAAEVLEEQADHIEWEAQR